MKILSLSDMMRDLRLKSVPHSWDGFFDEAMKELNSNGLDCVQEDYLFSLNRDFLIFRDHFLDLLTAAEKIRHMPAMMCFISLLNCSLRYHDDAKAMEQLEFPMPDDGDPIPYNFAPMFSILSTVRDTAEELNRRGVPDEIISNTMKEYEGCLKANLLRFGRLGCDMVHFFWLMRMIDAKLLNIGGLQFELMDKFNGRAAVFRSTIGKTVVLMDDIKIHRDGMILGWPGYQDTEGSYEADLVETGGYYKGYEVVDGHISQKTLLSKKIWEKVLAMDEPVISIHIPQGAKLDGGNFAESIKRAREILEKCYPNFRYKTFMCASWLLDPQLKDMLGANSNIVGFQNCFEIFPGSGSTGAEVLFFVFIKGYDRLEDLSDNTRLERALKRHYLNGGYIYKYYGILVL